MDKSAIKTYAVEARRKLIEAVKLKAQQLYIFEDSGEYIKRKITQNDVPTLTRSDGIFLSPEQLQARGRLFGELLHEGSPYKPAIYNRVMENVACTWFNRLIALRIMEVNDWLPSNIRILSSREPGRAEPDAMREVERLDYVNQSKVVELRADTEINASEKLYKYILISQCNALSEVLPGMFQKEDDYTELLLPDALLAKGGIVNDLVTQIHEDNFNVDKQGQIEIVGWLYQFYISEKKDEVFAGLKKNIKINKDTIPAATQLFTPEWIVKYMVENSLGRLWLEKETEKIQLGTWTLKSNETFILNGIPTIEYGLGNVSTVNQNTISYTLSYADKTQWTKILAENYGWKYYVPEADQDPEVAEQLRILRSQNPVKRPEDLKLIDPCMGSGHILVYAFDVLFQIYQSEGHSERDIPNLILQNNLYGLDIDDRAEQLAYFALMIKARSYNRRFFRQENIPQPMVYAIPETKVNVIGFAKLLGASMAENDQKAALEDLRYLVELFSNGKEYGSAMKIEREIDLERLRNYIRDYATGQMTIEEVEFAQQVENFDRLIEVAAVLMQKYDVVVTNPPYMTPAPSQADWIKKNYPNSKSDLCVVFIERNFELLKKHGYLSMITMHSWMFLSSYEKFRKDLIKSKTIINMAHLGARAFDEIGGEVVQTTTFIMGKAHIKDYQASFKRLVSYIGQQAKESAFSIKENIYSSRNEDFAKIPGMPFAYWISKFVSEIFGTSASLRDVANPRLGFATGDNDTFMRLWTEVSHKNIGFNFSTRENASSCGRKWFPTNKGGEFRRWYGNVGLVVNWENDGFAIRNFKDSTGYLRSRPQNLKDCFQQGISWTVISNKSSFRFSPVGFLYNNKGPIINSTSGVWDFYVLGYLNSSVSTYLLLALTPTLGFEAGYLAALPFIQNDSKKEALDYLVKSNIRISTADWDSFETSWDFQTHPLLPKKED